MNRWLILMLAGLFWGITGTAAWALEFSADQITRSNGHSRKANIYYRGEGLRRQLLLWTGLANKPMI